MSAYGAMLDRVNRITGVRGSMVVAAEDGLIVEEDLMVGVPGPAAAALVAACDLVITVDTMIAHLSGALGRPTWLLLRADPDWRWTPGARTTPWYPATRLYHQPRPGDWASVIKEVAHDLSARYADSLSAAESP